MPSSSTRFAAGISAWSSLKSGNPVYNWLDRAKNMIELYDLSMAGGEGLQEYDNGIGHWSGSWKSDNIEVVRPLVKAFKNRRAILRTSATTRTGEEGGTRHTSQPLPPHSASNRLMKNEKCKNALNQGLYSEVVTAATNRFSVAKETGREGHKFTGQNWINVAEAIKKVSIFCYRVPPSILCVRFVSLALHNNNNNNNNNNNYH